MWNIIRCGYILLIFFIVQSEFFVSISLTPFATSVGSLCTSCPFDFPNIYVFGISFLPHLKENNARFMEQNGQKSKMECVSNNQLKGSVKI